MQLNSGAMDSEVLWFSIGSVDTLERNLENAQNDLGIEVGAAGFVKMRKLYLWSCENCICEVVRTVFVKL